MCELKPVPQEVSECVGCSCLPGCHAPPPPSPATILHCPSGFLPPVGAVPCRCPATATHRVPATATSRFPAAAPCQCSLYPGVHGKGCAAAIMQDCRVVPLPALYVGLSAGFIPIKALTPVLTPDPTPWPLQS